MSVDRLLDSLLDELADRVAARLAAPKASDFVDQQTVGFDAKTYVRAARAGAFPASKVGRRWVARRADVEKWLDGQRARPDQAPAGASANGRLHALGPLRYRGGGAGWLT